MKATSMLSTDTALGFTVAGARLALRVIHVLEVVPIAALTQAPETPEVIMGFLSLDSQFVPIVRLEQLLRLESHASGDWKPEENLSNRIVVAKVSGGLLGWIIAESADLIRFDPTKLVRLPPGHILNDCAEYVIARTPPEPSIVLLEPDRLLLEKERTCVEEIRARVRERVRAFDSSGDRR